MVSARLSLALGSCFSRILLSRMQKVWEDEILTKETKQDVFDRLLKEHCKTILDLNPASAETDVKQIVENVFRDHYAAASPCNLPVIPHAVGELIKAQKQRHLPLSNVLGSVQALAITRTASNSPVMRWVVGHEDVFALAWLLDDWEVEE